MDNVVQGSPEWFQARLGMVTASKIVDVMSKGRGNAESVTRKNYMAQLVAERLSGQASEGFTNAAIEWGNECEPQARATYEVLTDRSVQEVGFIPHPSITMAGASPDGLVGDKGLIEIKCPNTATHIETMRADKIDRKYALQMQWQMECTGREWCDFVSFDPRLPANASLHIIRVDCDEELQSEIRKAVTTFLEELNALETELRQRGESEAVA
ncbi:exodeoxyribonuclease (lambda-induced) [Maritalea myrionectae]|uniref:Exodeoxyribonuclease (Lambda-induced) n=1 Tax=Maritalea myrionectae TaxID=454601 RepID=A0A2R4MDZ2_9HYPH|nr:lambda exonuclease family protein [Maritalea myrionectae]AVX04193.1 exodeoxyribonuclease (lambda-induced) [Maritalea myrionectae]